MYKGRFNLDGVSQKELSDYMLAKMQSRLAEVPAWKGKVQNTAEVEKITRWLLEGKRTSLLLQGGVGCGKTIFALALAQTLAVRNLCPYFIPMEKLVKMAKADNEVPECVYENRIIVLDDVGTEPLEVNIYGNRYELFNEILYARYARRQPTILTTNLTWDALGNKYGPRIMSRLGEMCDTMIFPGRDLRNQ